MSDDERIDDKSRRQRRFRLKNVHSRRNKQTMAAKNQGEKQRKKAHRPKFDWDDFSDDDEFSEYEGYYDDE